MSSKSTIFNYFKKISDSKKKLAECVLCSKVLSYESTTHNLKAHLQRVHSVTIVNSSKKKTVIRRLVPRIWNYFTLIDDDKKLASCDFCNEKYSFKTTTGNLTTHLKKKHANEISPDDWNEAVNDGQVGGESGNVEAENEEDENSDEETSELWSYFERDGAGRARCAVCCTKVYSHAASLTAHLKSKHPKLLSEPVSPQGSDHQNEDDEETFTDVIYLEEETPNMKETPVKEKKDKLDLSYSFKSQPSTSKYRSRKRSSSQSSDEIVYKKKRNASDRRQTSFKKSTQDDDDTEIESFGSYVVCLLKKLPRNVSMKLQRDIINLIMNANLNEASNEMPNKIVLDGNKIYMVSNNDGTATKISDGADTLENHSFDIKVTMNDNEKNQDSDARSVKMLE